MVGGREAVSQHSVSTFVFLVHHLWKGQTSLVTHLSCAPTVCLHRSECLDQAVGRRTLCPDTCNGHVVRATVLQLRREEVTVTCNLLVQRLCGPPWPPGGLMAPTTERSLKVCVHTRRCRGISGWRGHFAVGFLSAVWHSVLNLLLGVIFEVWRAVEFHWILHYASSEMIIYKWLCFCHLFARWITWTALIKLNRPYISGINLTLPRHAFFWYITVFIGWYCT